MASSRRKSKTVRTRATAVHKRGQPRPAGPRRVPLDECLERVTDGFVVLDRQWRYVYVNAKAAAIMGKTPRELLGRIVWAVFPEAVGSVFHKAHEKALAEQKPVFIEAYMAAPWDRWFENRIYPSPEGLSVFFTDVTERKRAREEHERLLRRAEAEKRRLERLAECVPSGIVLAEAPSGRVLFSNRRAAELMGRPVRRPRSIKNYKGAQFFGSDGRPLSSEEYPLARAVRTGETILDEEYQYERPDGRRRTFLVSATGVRGDDGEIDSAVASFHDVTDSRLARDALRGLSQRLISAQEEERRRISRDLHDDLGQVLTAIKISLGTLLRHPEALSIEEAVGHAGGLIDGVLDRVRSLSLHLRPPMLDHLGLGPTLRWYVESALRESTVVPRVSIGLTRVELPGELASACFRVAQEAITNVLRHAHARHVWLHAGVRSNVLRLAVRDDGRGFDMHVARAAATGRSLGLVSMQERAALAGGELEVRSRPGAGTRVVARFPLPPRPRRTGPAKELA